MANILTPGTNTRGASFATTNTLTWTSPTVSGSNTLGVVQIGYKGTPTVTGITWNGVAMTNVSGAAILGATTGVAIFYILNPAAGATNVVISASSNWTCMFGSAMFWTGANRTTFVIDAVTTNTGASSANFSGSITTHYGNEYIVDSVCQDTASGVPTVDSPGTRIQAGNNGSFDWGSGYNGSFSTTGSKSIAWTSTLADTWIQGIVSIRPLADGVILAA